MKPKANPNAELKLKAVFYSYTKRISHLKRKLDFEFV